MIKLSILLPTYNNDCYAFVAELHRQAENVEGLTFEILVADDGSTDGQALASNHRLNALRHCRFIVRKENAGRAVIRNFLARQAQYDHLLFLDSDMTVESPLFVCEYLDHSNAPVVYGGYVVQGQGSRLRGNLRYRYEMKSAPLHTCGQRQKHPYADFHTSNFMIHRDIMLAHPFDERFRNYGYEDVFFGRVLRENGIGITHIDNPVVFADFETNAQFVAKTEEGLHTLSAFSSELEGYSSLLAFASRLRRLHLAGVVKAFYLPFAPLLRRHLSGCNPSLLVFKFYKLGYFLSIR